MHIAFRPEDAFICSQWKHSVAFSYWPVNPLTLGYSQWYSTKVKSKAMHIAFRPEDAFICSQWKHSVAFSYWPVNPLTHLSTYCITTHGTY